MLLPRTLAAASLLACLACARAHVHAHEDPAATAGYEARMVERALAELGLVRHPDPAGRLIEEVHVLPYDVVGEDDPWPAFANWFHVTTKDPVVRRELLLGPGDHYDRSLVDESERNLRAMFFLATARIVPVRALDEEKVSLLVVTRDLWSLRTNSNIVYNAGVLEQLLLAPAEHNILGRGKTAAVRFLLLQDIVRLGALYQDPRVWGSRVGLYPDASFDINRDSGDVEGGAAAISVIRPLDTLATEWSYGATISGARSFVRVFRGARLARYDDTDTPDCECVPYRFLNRFVDAQAWLTRSYGRGYKHDVTLGLGTLWYRNGTLDVDASLPGTPAFVANALPRSRNYRFLSLTYQFFESQHYEKFLDLDRFALTEDVRLGPTLTAKVLWGTPLLSSRETFVTLSLSLGWRWLLWGDLLSASVTGGTRHDETDRAGPASAPWQDNHVQVTVANVTPVLGIGRLHVAALAELRDDDTLNTRLRLGGTNGLRGFVSNALEGRQLVRLNVEYRSISYDLWGIHSGFVVFFDSGNAADRARDLFPLLNSAGLGARIMLPQFNLEVLRADVGFALTPTARRLAGGPAEFTVTFRQAF
jgi:hypothetical protein